MGQRLRAFRVEKGWSLSVVMDKCKMDRMHISKIERDQFGSVRMETIAKLLKVYGKTWKDLDT